jgi:hypothetical protein
LADSATSRCAPAIWVHLAEVDPELPVGLASDENSGQAKADVDRRS